jgi:hypothetical protein
MATEKQIVANRRNSLLSSGPKTQAGKRASSANSLRHGLTARNNDNLDGGIESGLHPDPAGERRLAQAVAGDHSRLNKARALRNSAGAAGPHSIHLLSRYERTSYRSMRIHLRLFNEMQSSRRAIEQATLLGAGFPDPNGFEFANDKIAA